MSERKSEFIENVKEAIQYLMKRQIGTCLVLSSYKVSSVLRDRFGTDVNISKVGRFIAKFAKVNELERLPTNVPKFKINKDQFNKLRFDVLDARKSKKGK